MIRIGAKIAELKVKSEFFEKEIKTQAGLDRTRNEKELAAAQAAYKIHRKCFEDSYALTSS